MFDEKFKKTIENDEKIEANILFKITYYMTPLPKFGMI